MNWRRRYGGVLAGLICLTMLGVVEAPAGAGTHSQLNPGGLVVSVSPSTAAPGETIEVSGLHFPPGIGVTGEICGNDDLSGSPDCLLDETGTSSTSSDGGFGMLLTVGIPPVPCPCVAAITSTALSTTPSSPVTIIGAPVAPIRTPASAVAVTRPLQIVNAQISGNGPWYAWFGGIAQRTLTLTVRNPNTGVYPHPSLVLTAGKSGTFSTVSTSPLPSIGPGKATTVHVKVVFPAFSFGENEVRGLVGDAALQENIQVTTTIAPWGLIVIALILLQLIFLAIRNAVRRRNARDEPDPARNPESEGPRTPPDGVPAQPSSEKLPQQVGAV